MIVGFLTLASHGGPNPAVGLGVAVGIIVISGVIYALAKFLASAGLIVIPLLCGAIAAWMAGRGDGSALIGLPVLLVGGVMGTLACQLLANMREIEKRIGRGERHAVAAPASDDARDDKAQAALHRRVARRATPSEVFSHRDVER